MHEKSFDASAAGLSGYSFFRSRLINRPMAASGSQSLVEDGMDLVEDRSLDLLFTAELMK